MRSRKQKKKELSEEQLEIIDTKDFFDRIAPGIIRFYTDHYICGNSFRCVWAVPDSLLRQSELLYHNQTGMFRPYPEHQP